MVYPTESEMRMALTPEQVKTQNFNVTKFRDGYDLDQVDDFLDQVVADLEARDAEKQELEAKIAELTEKLEKAEAASQEQTPAAATAAAEEPQAQEEQKASAGTFQDGDAVKSSAMLQLALELHDKYVSEGETKRDELIKEGEATATRLVEEAETERENVLLTLGNERLDLSGKIEKLREFEDEYRTTLRSYIQGQLRDLDGSPAPTNVPELD